MNRFLRFILCCCYELEEEEEYNQEDINVYSEMWIEHTIYVPQHNLLLEAVVDIKDSHI